MGEGMQAATLRYFEPGGAFAAAVREATGAALPQPLEAAQSADGELTLAWRNRKSTRLNSSHSQISYAVFCLKKKQREHPTQPQGTVLLHKPSAFTDQHHGILEVDDGV